MSKGLHVESGRKASCSFVCTRTKVPWEYMCGCMMHCKVCHKHVCTQYVGVRVVELLHVCFIHTPLEYQVFHTHTVGIPSDSYTHCWNTE